MASSTIRLLDTIEWAKKFNFNRRLGIGNFLEPAKTSANTVLQAILGPPFAWRWNRAIKTYTCTAHSQDVATTLTDFGWIETASVQDTAPTPNKWYQITPKISLALETAEARPSFVGAQIDDGSGGITFRHMPTPNLAYPVSLTYQKKAPLFTTLSQIWAPIPDEYSYIYNWGFLAMMWLFSDDPRFQIANGKFVSHLLAANQGLDQTQINIFLSQWQSVTGQPIVNQDRLQQGFQGRAV